MTKLSKTLSYLLVFVMLGVSISACAAPESADRSSNGGTDRCAD